MSNPFLKLMLKISGVLRQKRMRRFREHFNLTAESRVLDVGGSGDWNWKAYGIDAQITVLNLSPRPANCAAEYVQGSACDMYMFDENEFDLVFSNSVIEHLLSQDDQKKMAEEILRVGNAYWVQTPNRHFPIELHLCFPFFQYLPLKCRLLIAQYWPFSFQKLRGKTEGAIADAQAILLTKADLQSLFPDTEIICERFMGLTKSLIAFRGCQTTEG
jgi:hypothetical protein